MYKLYLEENISSKKLLEKVLLEENITSYNVIYNKYGKPYLKNNPFYFNISHDKITTALVVSDKEVGVDLQYLTFRKAVVDKFFTKGEQQIIEKSKNKEYNFTKIWVMKEAFVKMKGTGITYGLEKVDTTKLKKKIDVIDKGAYLIAICRSEE